MSAKVIDFAAAKEANKLPKIDELAEALRVLATKSEADEIHNIFIAWTMADGTIHYGHATLQKPGVDPTGDNLRLLGLMRIAERSFLDAVTISPNE